jgi:hypothetical protein
MSILTIETVDGQVWFKPGTTVAGEASWHLDGDADAVELRLFWFTEGKGSQDVEMVDSIRVKEVEPNGRASFRFQLPNGPYSFSGKLITLAWAVELVVLPSQETERLDVIVGPRPVEVSIAHPSEY